MTGTEENIQVPEHTSLQKTVYNLQKEKNKFPVEACNVTTGKEDNRVISRLNR